VSKTSGTSLSATSGSGLPKDELRDLGYSRLGPIAAGAFSTIIRAREQSSQREVAIKTYAMRARGGRAPGVAPEAVSFWLWGCSSFLFRPRRCDKNLTLAMRTMMMMMTTNAPRANALRRG
jgi:hypothetical protein